MWVVEVQGLLIGSIDWGSGMRVCGLGFGVEGSGFGVTLTKLAFAVLGA